jgi:hypothetical protein
MTKRMQQIADLQAELKLGALPANRRRDLHGMLKQARFLLSQGR